VSKKGGRAGGREGGREEGAYLEHAGDVGGGDGLAAEGSTLVLRFKYK